MGIVLKGGLVASPSGAARMDLRIEGEQVHSLGFDLEREGDEVVDCGGMLILPGGVDPHTHFDLPAGDFRTADDFKSGTMAALAGGTTTIIDYATQFKGESLRQGIEEWHRLSRGKCHCDYGFHLAVTDWNDEVERELPQVVKGGIPSFKMYMAYKGLLQLDDGSIMRMMELLRDLGGVLCLHCENGDLVSSMGERLAREGRLSPRYHPLSRPSFVESEAVFRALTMAEAVQAPLYVVHVSSAKSMEHIRAFKERGNQVWAETCVQYLTLDEGRYLLPDGDASAYVCSPPLRSRGDVEALWMDLEGGYVDVVATDHCSFNLIGHKDRGLKDFRRIPNGLPGVEHRLSILYSEGVEGGRISLGTFVNVVSTSPAKIFGLYPRKGILLPGSDADVVVFDPNSRWTVRASQQVQRVDYTPYEGWSVTGRVVSVYLRGSRAYHRGVFEGQEPAGQYLLRRGRKEEE
ncbi:D-hydantoinase [Thermanaerovibrio velox DSM 12556]|uniref:D-hydantoinase n=1 Tax=Thermanaerovibrio velox DSM 12556 TaxID=926567 RepID=H0UNZ4_9BACT|nr:dihydropyrimidinase [Thermanaerovibrio velox]EHM10497.1 D-hydantoinase [Thermanaerovibrio velox DSM 12556]